jgi:hypothetical protein
MRRSARLAGLCAVLALALLVGGCAKNGGFDPTDLFASDMFDTKKKLKGERKELFPTGVPGASTGVPPDLVKGYQAPPDPVTADQSNPAAAPGGPPGGPKDATPAATADAAADAAAEEPKPKPKPKVARAKASDPIWGRAPAATAKPASRPTQIEVNRSAPQPAAPTPQATAPAPQRSQQAASPWPDPPPEQQQAGQSVFPPPPPPGTFSR